MCHYITLVLASPTNMAELEAIAGRHKRKLEPLSNQSMKEHLKQGEEYFFTTKGICDCGTTLGYEARRSAKQNPIDLGPQIKKLKAKGWSQSKIDRWVSDKAHHDEKQIASTKSDEHWNDDWFAFLSELLESKLIRYVCLLLHWYSGPLTGRITLKGRICVNLYEQGIDFLLKIQEDILYEFR